MIPTYGTANSSLVAYPRPLLPYRRENYTDDGSGGRLNNQQTAALAPGVETDAERSERHGWYLVFTLLLFYIFSFIDRQIISLLVEPIKRDLQVSDTQVGLLGGLTFALFYTFFGIPIGRLADRMNRKSIIAFGVIAWSLMATWCGLAKNWTQLVIARAGVGVVERLTVGQAGEAVALRDPVQLAHVLERRHRELDRALPVVDRAAVNL